MPGNRNVVLMPEDIDIEITPYGAEYSSGQTVYHIHRLSIFGFTMFIASLSPIINGEMNSNAFELIISEAGKQIVDRSYSSMG